MRPAAAIAVVVVTAAAIVGLREATMSRHEPVRAGTSTELVVVASTNRDEADLVRRVGALFLGCELDVPSLPVGQPERIDRRTFVLRVRPALDDTDRRQLAGCLADARVDHLRTTVLGIRDVDDRAGHR